MSNDSDPADRRTILRSGGLLAAAGVAVLGAQAEAKPMSAHRRRSDIETLQVALSLEHEGIAAYDLAGGSGLLKPEVLKIGLLFRDHHKGHRDALEKIIRKAGATPVARKTDAEYVKALDLGALKSQEDVLKLATKLEKGAANAYVSQLASLKDPELLHLFAQLSSDEAVHWAILANAIGQPIPAPAFIFG
jgi:rubrerythrin